ncbi:MAG: hypothetical protein H0X37_09595 [Herpetosiphonaceae bacterium]|nr:hypothetical protein [Herpetosiphonaceae bacterium]
MRRDTEIKLEHPPEVDVLSVHTTTFLPVWLEKTLLVIAGLSLFILALRMLTKGAGAVGPLMIHALHIHGATNTLGFGWLFASIVLSGAPVASVALTFLASHVLTPLETFTMITGSRLGADMIVFFIGFIYFLRGHPKSTSISLGVIAQSVTATTYLPALPFGYWLLTSHVMDHAHVALPKSITGLVQVVFDPIVTFTAAHLNAWLVFLLGLGAVLIAFRILDRALPHLDADQRAFGRVGRLVYRPFAMFALGMIVTLIGMSVSVSISLLVPLSARGIIRRENTVPYILGSNLATLIDKLLPAVLVGHPLAVPIILIEMVTISTISLGIMLFFYRPYERFILGVLDRVIESNRALALFMGLMVGVPLVLILI